MKGEEHTVAAVRPHDHVSCPRSIVHRRQHHPSVFGYTLSNEISWGGPGDAQFVELYRFAKQHDPERPCWYQPS